MSIKKLKEAIDDLEIGGTKGPFIRITTASFQKLIKTAEKVKNE